MSAKQGEAAKLRSQHTDMSTIIPPTDELTSRHTNNVIVRASGRVDLTSRHTNHVIIRAKGRVDRQNTTDATMINQLD